METYKNYSYTIEQDECYDSPRSWDNLGTCIFRGTHSALGDDHTLDFSSCRGWKDEEAVIRREYGKDCVIIPVYAYIHSGMTIKTTPFNDFWDSGRLGSIVVSREKIRKDYNVSRVTENVLNTAIACLEGEIKTLDQFITGDIWSYTITDPDGQEVDSCGGYYGYNDTIDEVHSVIEHIIKTTEQNCGVQQELTL
jgi:hypothetical protein